ncbi:head GIN domain-containing protein [Labilibaculum sp. K2S]|uniref:head GIN domain-containing protein n=1 Tax=Labilibaculum sp. K2S TaxID=3056386 RepID=UPI0025A3DC5E|nr:head GIN domain-containing protein [Labilibaculum sp. K2S]MDM8159202.1 head GIN domain-containing protein [Labilibaculum sp. K2S]
MNTKRITSLLTVFALVLSGSLAFAQKTETRNVGSFESVSLAIHAKVFITQENSTSVKMKGDADDLEEIITEVEDGTLKIKRRKNKSWGWNNSFKNIEVYISSSQIKNLSISGSGNIVAKSPIETTNAKYAISGSGNIFIEDLSAENVECHISGSGDINLKGNGLKELEIHISGSGDVDAGNLKSENVSVRVSGSGDCKVYATKNLNARVAGSGDIYYRGKPDFIDSKSAGSGHIKSIGM